MNKGKWNKTQRMQLKALICVLGILLILILLAVKFLLFLIPAKPEEEVHIPVVEMLSNVWIMEADEEKLLIFRDGEEESYPYGIVENEGEAQKEPNTDASFREKVREQIADIVLTDGKVTDIQVKTEKINGKVLSADATGVELEGYGRIAFTEDYKGYRIYNALTMCTVSDLAFGYNFADFVLEDGKICGILMVKEEAMEYIRVLVKASDYAALLHEQIIVTSDTDFTIQYGTYDNRQTESHTAGEEITIDRNSPYFTDGRVLIVPNALTGKVILKNVNRSQGTPSYRGHMELVAVEEGLAVINEVLLEEYLYCVVPSEMPASYPDEALQAQAVCARTYAYGHMQRAGYPQYGAHVDDSTSYQVYNNILEQETTTTAVKETYGQLLFTPEGALAGTYYYSTSYGVGTDANVWKTEEANTLTYLQAKALNQSSMQAVVEGNAGSEENRSDDGDIGEMLRDEAAFANFITSTNADDFEVSEGWYRWNYQVEKVDTTHMLEILQKRYNANGKLILTQQGEEYVSEPVEAFSEIKELYIAQRGVGGVADELIIVTDKNIYKVISEHNIRYVLNNGESKIVRQDGSEVASPNLLPSAFFVLSVSKEGENVVSYTLTGGGFGHGVGMSQNGAKNMAKSGYTSDQILTFFFDGCTVQSVYTP